MPRAPGWIRPLPPLRRRHLPNSNSRPVAAQEAASPVFRSDLYRRNLRDVGAELPGASEKLEGSLHHRSAVSSESGKLILEPDAFFDGYIFDPSA